jgi:hypothetical protein
MALPHYINSPISMNKFEPLYMNLFDVAITLPQAIAGNDAKLLVEEITKVDGLDVDKVPPAGITQVYKGAQRRFANAITDQTTIDIAIEFQVNLDDSNSAFCYKTLRAWCDLVWDPLTGAMMLKKDYTGGPMVVSVHNRRGDVYRQITAPVIWPTTNINAMALDYIGGGSTAFIISGMTFASDYWEDVSV